MIAAVMATMSVLASSPTLGIAEGTCRPSEPGPAFDVVAEGLKDRSGVLRLELYPAADDDFLADDNVLIMAGKAFARVVVPAAGRQPIRMCIRAPRPGRYALSLVHDRNGNRTLDPSSDGIGFANNPRLGWSKPKAEAVSAAVGTGIASLPIRLNYMRGFAMRPLEAK
ncbi:MAG: hypothetical protein JWR77_896 [Rhizorhabdus sp.]|nr:hypothetical protein [Rhizorhabdus sp.]